jgi:hypothetical protein
MSELAGSPRQSSSEKVKTPQPLLARMRETPSDKKLLNTYGLVAQVPLSGSVTDELSLSALTGP